MVIKETKIYELVFFIRREHRVTVRPMLIWPVICGKGIRGSGKYKCVC